MAKAGGDEIRVQHVAGPRLFPSTATSGGAAKRGAATALRKCVNGSSEALFKLSPRLGRYLNSSWSSAFFVVAARKAAT